jgi:tRNA A37 methylthiotransferase MiaB
VARERNRILRELAAKKKQAFMREFVGQKIEAITLNVISETADGICTEALTDNYLKLRVKGTHQPNRWFKAHISSVGNDHLVGNISRVI